MENGFACETSKRLYEHMIRLGYEPRLCRVIAGKYMTTDYTATRMLGYLYRMSEPPKETDVVDEMLAILSDRELFIRKKEAEHANAAVSRLYSEGLAAQEEEK